MLKATNGGKVGTHEIVCRGRHLERDLRVKFTVVGNNACDVDAS